MLWKILQAGTQPLNLPTLNDVDVGQYRSGSTSEQTQLFNIRAAAERSPLDAVVDSLRDVRTLLLLDNLVQVPDAGSTIAGLSG